jgi:hypothetical protein
MTNPIKYLELMKSSLETLKKGLALGKWKKYPKNSRKFPNILINV